MSSVLWRAHLYDVQAPPDFGAVLPGKEDAAAAVLFAFGALDKGIAHTYIKPGTPWLNGAVERSHRIGVEEFYCLFDGVIIRGGLPADFDEAAWHDAL